MKKFKVFNKDVFIQFVSILLILLFGLSVHILLGNFNRKIFESQKEENKLNVRVLVVQPKNYVTSINGYGTVKPFKSVILSSEISGKIVFVNPNLKVGNVVFAGEVLFELDKLKYSVDVCLAGLNVVKHQSIIKKLKRQQKIDIYRINSLEKNKVIAYYELKRIKYLFEKYKIGKKDDLEMAERSYNSVRDNLDQLIKLVSLYSIRLSDEKNNLNVAKIQLVKSKYFLEKCKVINPFFSRIKNFYINEGEFILFGKEAVVLEDNNNLEIETFLDLDDVKKWLEFDFCGKECFVDNSFNRIIPVISKIVCKESNNFDIFVGCVNRVRNFDINTRNIKINLNVLKENFNYKKINTFPILNGMFCEITIPTKVLKRVLKIPRSTVGFKNEVYVVDSKKCLKSFFVNIVKKERDYIFIKNDIVVFKPIILTRLIDPIEGSFLQVEEILKEFVN